MCQGMRVEKDFDISNEAGGVGKEIVKKYNVNVNRTLEIRLYWAGKGTINIPFHGVYGPLISAISVDPSKLLIILILMCSGPESQSGVTSSF